MPKKEVSMSENIHDFLVRIAWLYYKERWSQEKIAKDLNICRTKVVRALQKAREDGIVTFYVWGSRNNCLSLEQKLKKRFNLTDAMVIPTSLSGDVRLSLGKAGAQFLYKNLSNKDIVGIAWGRTIYEVITNFTGKSVENVKVVNLMGGLTTSMSLNPYDIAGKLASMIDGQCYYLYAPAITNSEESCKLFKLEASIKETLQIARNASISLVGVGEVSPRWTIIQLGYMSLQELEVCKAQGAVGSILGQFFDKAGNKIDCEINRRLVALPLEELRNSPNVVTVAGGGSKAKAILGGIRGNYIKILITDERTAIKLIELDTSGE